MHYSPSRRIDFQWQYVHDYFNDHPEAGKGGEPPILNIGCSDDPVGFGEFARHVDIDDWSYKHKYFTQADAAKLPFGDASYDVIVLGDILEHVESPKKVTDEAMRVCAPNGLILMTVFEEWRLPGPGQWINEGHEIGDKMNRDLGFKDREDWQRKHYPEMIGFDDNKVSHLVHINQFTPADMQALCAYVSTQGFALIHFDYVCDAVHEGHPCMNWLIAFKRSST